jgi:hypothetical protein
VSRDRFCFDLFLFLDRKQSHNAIIARIITATAPTATPPMAPLLICEDEAAKFWPDPEVGITVLLPDTTVVAMVIELAVVCDEKTPTPDSVVSVLWVLDDVEDVDDDEF